MKANKLEELIQHHEYAKQEAWSLANELYSVDSSKYSEDDLRALEAAKRDMSNEYAFRALFLADLENLRDEK